MLISSLVGCERVYQKRAYGHGFPLGLFSLSVMVVVVV